MLTHRLPRGALSPKEYGGAVARGMGTNAQPRKQQRPVTSLPPKMSSIVSLAWGPLSLPDHSRPSGVLPFGSKERLCLTVTDN